MSRQNDDQPKLTFSYLSFGVEQRGTSIHGPDFVRWRGFGWSSSVRLVPNLTFAFCSARSRGKASAPSSVSLDRNVESGSG